MNGHTLKRSVEIDFCYRIVLNKCTSPNNGPIYLDKKRKFFTFDPLQKFIQRLFKVITPQIGKCSVKCVTPLNVYWGLFVVYIFYNHGNWNSGVFCWFIKWFQLGIYLCVNEYELILGTSEL